MSDGVIKYKNFHQKLDLETYPDLAQLNHIRSELYAQNLIGIVNSVAYGNISLRQGQNFIITASGTSAYPKLEASDYSLVYKVNIKENVLYSQGLYPPSSEAMTHAALYESSKEIAAVIHVHSANLFQKLIQAKAPHTAANIEYGTVQMALATKELAKQLGNQAIFYMAGHEKGVISYATSLTKAWELIQKEV